MAINNHIGDLMDPDLDPYLFEQINTAAKTGQMLKIVNLKNVYYTPFDILIRIKNGQKFYGLIRLVDPEEYLNIYRNQVNQATKKLDYATERVNQYLKQINN